MQQIFKVRNLKSTNNKLCNKRLPSATVNQRTNTVECHHIDEIPTVTWYVKQLTRAEFPLSLNHCLSYFEAEVVGASEEQTYNIGLISKDGNMRQYAGRTINSIGYSKNSSDQKFEIYLSKKKISSLSHDKLKLKDRIGCGVKCQNRTFFFTKNGTMIMQDIPIPLCWSQFYPAVGMNCKDEALRCYFNYDQCVFNVAMYAKSIETISTCL